MTKRVKIFTIIIIQKKIHTPKLVRYTVDTNDYIGWSARGGLTMNNYYTPNGLFCGWQYEKSMFYQNKFVYCSNNENYKTGLRAINNGDIVVFINFIIFKTK